MTKEDIIGLCVGIFLVISYMLIMVWFAKILLKNKDKL